MPAHNPNDRLEIFCDGVIAIAITLLVLEIKVPPVSEIHSSDDLKHALLHHWPSWFAFVLSFGTIFIAWVNHHNFYKYLNKTSTLFVYANGLFLLSIAILPFPTALMADYINTDYAKNAIIVYCFISLFHNLSWIVLFQSALQPKSLAKNETAHNRLVLGRKQSTYGLVIYLLNCALAFWLPYVALGILVVSWAAWILVGLFFGDKTIEQGEL